jgi:hypothetical protein
MKKLLALVALTLLLFGTAALPPRGGGFMDRLDARAQRLRDGVIVLETLVHDHRHRLSDVEDALATPTLPSRIAREIP